MDGVLAYDMVIEWSKQLKNLFPEETLGRDWRHIKQYDICKTFPLLTREQIFVPVQQKGFYLNLKPEPFALETLNTLLNEGHHLYIASNICGVPHSAEEKIQWLKKYFPFIPEKNIIFTYQKSLLKLDVLVDDWEENLKYGSYKGFLYSQPWNDFVSPDDIDKVKNFKDFKEKFDIWQSKLL